MKMPGSLPQNVIISTTATDIGSGCFGQQASKQYPTCRQRFMYQADLAAENTSASIS